LAPFLRERLTAALLFHGTARVAPAWSTSAYGEIQRGPDKIGRDFAAIMPRAFVRKS